MKTDIVDAHTIEVGDRVVLITDEIFLVREVNDNERVILTLQDEDGMVETFPFDPFDQILIYVGEDDVEIEDVPIEE